MAKRSATPLPMGESCGSFRRRRTTPKSPPHRLRSRRNMTGFNNHLSSRTDYGMVSGVLKSGIRSSIWIWILGLGILSALTSAEAASSSTLSDLKSYPPEINLSSAKARQRFVIQATYSDGLTRDVTTEATAKIGDSKLVKLDKTIVAPVADGKTDLRISFKGKSVTV